MVMTTLPMPEQMHQRVGHDEQQPQALHATCLGHRKLVLEGVHDHTPESSVAQGHASRYGPARELTWGQLDVESAVSH